MTLTFKALGCLTLLAVVLEIAWMSMQANDRAEGQRASDIAAGRFP